MRFTVLTPTYNRAHTLSRVYESLCAQTFRDFEWLIIDDSSTDSTAQLVASWKPFFPIRYVWKANGGKHTAVNQGVSTAQGEFILLFDSDDWCTPNALERFDYHWRQIPDASRYAAVVGLCATPDGAVVGKPYPAPTVDAFKFADHLRLCDSERWGVHRTQVLRQFPYPEDEPFVIESLVWNRISQRYAARFVNEVVRIYEPGPGGIAQNYFRLRASSPKSTLAYYRELAFSPAPLALRLRALINYCRFAAFTAVSKQKRPASK